MPGISGPKPTQRARPSGGFNSMMGNSLNAEHMDENAMQQAAQNTQLTQQQADPQAAAQQVAAQKAQQQQQAPPREVGSIPQEGKRFVGDVWRELKQFFSLNTWLGIEEPEFLTPEQKTKAKQQHARFNQLTQEQQQYAKSLHQERLQKKKAQEEEQEHKRQREAAQKSAGPVMPSSPKKGAKGPGGKSSKQNAQQKLQQDRQRMGQAGGSH